MSVHVPVLAEEVGSFIREASPSIMVDGTAGAGGHAQFLLEKCLPGDSRYIAFDQDGEILEIAKEMLRPFGKRVIFVHSNFKNMKRELSLLDIEGVGAVLLDLGVSSLQLDRGDRGFAFKNEGLLDMRMDIRREMTAYDVINGYGEEELLRVLKEYSDLKQPRWYVRKIMEAREKKPLRTTTEFADLFLGAKSFQRRRGMKFHPATEVFQAVRIEVNDELKCLKEGLQSGFELLKPEGLLLVISFHSLEDRIVKDFYREKNEVCICPPKMPVCTCGKKRQARILTNKPVTATDEEMSRNVRARSAKLRVLKKLNTGI